MSPRVCVYASSSRSLSDRLRQAAQAFGRRAADLGWSLIFGGANIGLMDAAAQGFREGRGRVVSVIPRIFDRQGLTFDADEVHLTDDLRQRKRIMLDHADAFVVLPGGPGTLDEFFETLTLKQLGFHDKPMVLLNLDGHFDGTLSQLERMVAGGFAKDTLLELYDVAADVDAALAILEERRKGFPPAR